MTRPMITDEMKADGWVEHDGNAMPLARNALVRTRHRNGKQVGPHTAEHWDWWNTGHGMDILAYKPEQDHANG